jgi:iron complex transport system substrate-binding protein
VSDIAGYSGVVQGVVFMTKMEMNRRALVAAGAAVLAGSRLAGIGVAQPASPAASPADGLVLMPAAPDDLGAPAVPDPVASTDPDAVTMTDALAPYDEFGTSAAPGEFPRTIRHSMGETAIEASPQRIVTLDPGELDAAVQLGFVPVGTAEYGSYKLAEYVSEAVDDITLVGTTAEPDLEAIIGLQPDLILSSKLRHEALYDTLSAIAPTVFAERPGVSFKQNLQLYAQATGAEAAGAEVVARYEKRVRALNSVLPMPRPSLSIVQMRPDNIRFYQTANFLGVILRDLGFPRGEGQNVDAFAVDTSPEELGVYADGEIIILAVVDPDENDLASETLGGEVWEQLPAVQAGQVLEVDSAVWIGGVGYGAAFEVLDGLAAYFEV